MEKSVVKSITFVGAGVCFFLFTACGGGVDINESNEGVPAICPAVEQYFEPLVQINSVTDASTGEELTQIKMSALTIDGLDRPFDQLISEFLLSVDIIEDGDAAICTLPCALFTDQGDYSMVVSATAYEPKLIEFSPRYANSETEGFRCPRFSGSYELNFSLDPAF